MADTQHQGCHRQPGRTNNVHGRDERSILCVSEDVGRSARSLTQKQDTEHHAPNHTSA